MGRRARILVGLVALALGASAVARAQGLPADGWIVFEHFGQSPDGSTPEFDFDRREVWLAHPDGSDLHELSPGDPVGGKASPDVSPDGSTVVFGTWLEPNRVWELGIDGQGLRLLSGDCSGRDGDCVEGDPAYSPDGGRIALVHAGWDGGVGYTEIGIRDLAGGPARYLPSTRMPLAEGDLAQPSWSPDGTRIAYHRDGVRKERPDSNAYPASIRVWIVGADGADPHEVATPLGMDAADPDWAPDGRRIVYSTVGYRESEGVGDLRPRIFTIAPDGSDPVLLCDDAVDVGCLAPSWLPDGEHILYWGFRTWDLMAPDGSDKHPVDEAHLTWYADGLGYGYLATWVPPLD